MANVKKQGQRPKALKQDDSIMGTNNSSIVSKRSVERLYHPDGSHFFRPFVKKPQRRSPLINRGYWLRMKAIDHVVHQFLLEPSDKKKIVINLGCGYDPLPWQCLSRYPDACRSVTFVDIDYKDLMIKKRSVCLATPELKNALTNVTTDEGDILLRSDQYIQVGCDLRELPQLSKAMALAIDLDNTLVLATAEVSVTYMTGKGADSLIEWFGKLPDARFCLLEQLLPEGLDHPFAKTMMAHFDKLQTPLRSVQKYPTVVNQEERFKGAGWKHAKARNLWELWAADDFLSSQERKSLNDVEPFDEWEEFALFGCHYFLLVASTTDNLPPPVKIGGLPDSSLSFHDSSYVEPMTYDKVTIDETSSAYAEHSSPSACRRFGAAFSVAGSNRQLDIIGHFAGMGLNTRLPSCDVYGQTSTGDRAVSDNFSTDSPSARMCHTITELGETGALLVGGRTSPDRALGDCWLYHKWTNTWEKVDDLPIPRFRHSAISVGSDAVLVMGGKCDSRTFVEEHLIWRRRHGWVKCSVNAKGEAPMIFGAILTKMGDHNTDNSIVSGILAGGMSQDGVISRKIWSWMVRDLKEPIPSIDLVGIFPKEVPSSFFRFGASVVTYGGRHLLVGGVTGNEILTAGEEILAFTYDESNNVLGESPAILLQPRALLIGASATVADGELVILGGGAVCFSFGTFWNRGCYSISFISSRTDDNNVNGVLFDAWKYQHTLDVVQAPRVPQPMLQLHGQHERTAAEVVTIERRAVRSAEDFSRILTASRPAILEGLNLGECTQLWSSDYLKDRIGKDREVVIHQASTEHMNFVSKNFEYIKKPFGDFLDAIDAGERLYLRSLSAEKPSELPAEISRDFPTISDDFRLPPELAMVIENSHSSPLRMSGPVNMWLHYDVMANVLCQIRGFKRLLLFPSSDVQYFDFSAGASSSSMDVFSMLEGGQLGHTHAYEAILNPGDVLFIPPLWLHTARPIHGTSISVNVFFRNLLVGYAAGRDVYGNRDLQVYEKGRQDVSKVAKSFQGLPADVRNFYLQRLADELRQKAGPDA